jgi:hypothetical protein
MLAHHIVAVTIQIIQNLKFKFLTHPPYSPDLALCNFHAFGPLKEALHGCRVGSDEEAKEMVHTWIQQHTKTFSSDGIRKL